MHMNSFAPNPGLQSVGILEGSGVDDAVAGFEDGSVGREHILLGNVRIDKKGKGVDVSDTRITLSFRFYNVRAI